MRYQLHKLPDLQWNYMYLDNFLKTIQLEWQVTAGEGEVIGQVALYISLFVVMENWLKVSWNQR
jgi:hypothetical protein